MMAGDAMNRVAKALSQSASDQQQAGASSALMNRRQAIVPPKLATDASNSDESESNEVGAIAVGQLIDVGSNEEEEEGNGEQVGQRGHGDRAGGQLCSQDPKLQALRRKRSGGAERGATGQAVQQQQLRNEHQLSPTSQTRNASGSQSNIPTFLIEPEQPSNSETLSAPLQANFGSDACRPDSQMTNVDSIASSGSSANLSTR